MFDELASGVSSVAAPDIERAFETSHAMFAMFVFVGPGIVALVIEPLIFLAADRYPRAWFIRGGLTAMSLASFASGLAPGPFALAAATSVLWLAIGASSSLAQATLMDRDPDNRAKTLARWTLLGLIGDLCAPAILAVMAIAGLTWREGYMSVGALVGVWAIVAWLTPIDTPRETEESEEPTRGLLATLRDVLRDRTLVVWLFGLALCDLLDEILVVFATIHVRDGLGGGQLWQSAIVATLIASGAIGLVVLERLLKKHDESRLLVAFSAACAVAVGAWIAAPNLVASLVLVIPVGATATVLYPLVASRVFAQRPEESGAVLAASHLFTPLGLALPFLIGALADHAGTYAALAVLVAQPVGLIVLVKVTAARKLDD